MVKEEVLDYVIDKLHIISLSVYLHNHLVCVCDNLSSVSSLSGLYYSCSLTTVYC